jgi:hypothetical protein
MITYTYNVVADFPLGLCNPETLRQEIFESEITPKLIKVELNPVTKVLKLTFASTLRAAEKTILDGDTSAPAGGLIAAHNAKYTQTHTIVRDAMLEAAAGNIYEERTINLSGLNRNITDASSDLISECSTVLPQPATPGALTFISDSATESTTGAVQLLIEYLDENLIAQTVLVPTNNNNSVTVAPSAWRLQTARVAVAAAKYAPNVGMITFYIDGLELGCISPNESVMHRMFYTVPANKTAQIVSFALSTHDGSSDSVTEIQVHASVPIDQPFAPSGILYHSFSTGGTYQTSSRYVKEIPSKTDVWFTARKIGPGTAEAAGFVNFYERID